MVVYVRGTNYASVQPQEFKSTQAEMNDNHPICPSGSSARIALTLAGRFTDENLFTDFALVKAQAFPTHETRASAEPPKAALPLTYKHIEALESAIRCGETSQ